MKKVIKISDHKRWEIELIQMEKNGPSLINVRQFYCTKNDATWKPGRHGLTLSMEGDKSEAKRVLKALAAVYKNEDDEKPRLIPKRGKD